MFPQAGGYGLTRIAVINFWLSCGNVLMAVGRAAIIWIAAVPPPVRKASGFPFATYKRRGSASGGLAAKGVGALTERRSLSAREAAEPERKPKAMH